MLQAPGFSFCEDNMTHRFQRLLSITTLRHYRLECVEEGTLRVMGMKQAEGMAWARAERLAGEEKARAKATAEAAAALLVLQEAEAPFVNRWARDEAPRC